MSKQQKTNKNPQAEAIIEVAKGLHAIADAIRNKGANVPAIQETASTGNPTDDAIIEVAKGVHQISKGIESLPDGASVETNVQNKMVYRIQEQINFELGDGGFFDGGKTHSFGFSNVPAQFNRFARTARLVGDYGDAITPTELSAEANGSMGAFVMHRYVPQVTIEIDVTLEPTTRYDRREMILGNSSWDDEIIED